MRGVYKGYSVLLSTVVVQNYIKFGTYEYLQTHVVQDKTAVNNFLCGMVTGATQAVLVTTPQETLKTIIIHDRLSATPQYRGGFHCISETIKQAGFMGLYKGGLATLIKTSSNYGIRFCAFSDARDRLI